MQSSGRTNPFVNREELEGGRDAFLRRVRKGLGHDEGKSPTPQGLPELDQRLIRQVASDDAGRVKRFVEKMNENKGVVKRVGANREAVLGAIEECLAAHSVKRALMNVQGLAEAADFGVAGHLQGRGVETVQWGSADCFKQSFSCDASITDAHAGLADTGALLVWSDPGFGRSSTLVVPVHITLLPASRILGDMIDGLEMVLKSGAMPSNVVVINGPSKTGDIEMKLVTGVHGPKYIYVIVIDGM